MKRKPILVGGYTQDQRNKQLEKIKSKYEKKGYCFVEYIEGGPTKSMAIFDVDEMILKKETSRKLILLGVFILIIAALIYPKG